MNREELAKLLDKVLIVLHSHEQEGGVSASQIDLLPTGAVSIHLK